MDKKIKSTVVGSYPKPKYIIGELSGRELLDSSGESLHDRKRGRGAEFYGKLFDRAVRETIRDQEKSRC